MEFAIEPRRLGSSGHSLDRCQAMKTGVKMMKEAI